MVEVAVGEEHGVERAEVARRRAGAAQVRDAGAEQWVGEDSHAVQLDQDGRVTDVGDRAVTGRGRASP